MKIEGNTLTNVNPVPPESGTPISKLSKHVFDGCTSLTKLIGHATYQSQQGGTHTIEGTGGQAHAR